MFLLLFFIAFSNAVIDCNYFNRDDILDCFSKHIDSNNDGNLTLAEVSTVDALKGPAYFMMCDLNMDHVLNLKDWVNAGACCWTNPCLAMMCVTCFNKFNWTGI